MRWGGDIGGDTLWTACMQLSAKPKGAGGCGHLSWEKEECDGQPNPDSLCSEAAVQCFHKKIGSALCLPNKAILSIKEAHSRAMGLPDPPQGQHLPMVRATDPGCLWLHDCCGAIRTSPGPAPAHTCLQSQSARRTGLFTSVINVNPSLEETPLPSQDDSALGTLECTVH